MHVVRMRSYETQDKNTLCVLDIGVSNDSLDYITTDFSTKNCTYIIGQEIK